MQLCGYYRFNYLRSIFLLQHLFFKHLQLQYSNGNRQQYRKIKFLLYVFHIFILLYLVVLKCINILTLKKTLEGQNIFYFNIFYFILTYSTIRILF